VVSEPVFEASSGADGEVSKPALNTQGGEHWLAFESRNAALVRDVWLKALAWNPTAKTLDLSRPERPLRRTPTGNHSHPVLAKASFRDHALIAAWDALGTVDDPGARGVLQQLIPVPVLRTELAR
jgi:hypothetical protein